MTMWVIRQSLSADDELHITERADVELPFDGINDLSVITSEQQAKYVLRLLHPQEPPEAINRRVERFWQRYTSLQLEDLIVVPLPLSQQVVLGLVNGPYHYKVGDDGSDIHLIPVKWYDVRIPMFKLSRHKEIFASPHAMSEVKTVEARTAIRTYLPHSYNRFAKAKWIMGLFFLLSIVRLYHRLEH